MNPTSADPTAPPPPPQQQQPPRSSFSCDRHPAEQFTGFCPSCLCERLTTLDQSSSNTPSSSRRPSSASAAAAAAIRSLFSSNPKPSAPPPPPPAAAAAPKPLKPSFFPELRRTKSFSASKNEALGPSFEPQRKSCDVRARSTLSSLFTIDDGSKTAAGNCNQSSSKPSSIPASSIASTSHQNPQIPIRIESSVAHKPVFEETENQENFTDPVYFQDPILVCDDDSDDDGDEIKPIRDTHLENLRNSFEKEPNSNNIIEEVEEEEDLKPMKDHIDIINTHEKKSSGGGGGFWAAASVFSKKWRHKWRRKQKTKKPLINGTNFSTLPVEKPISRQYRETQSEIADYGFGRRSCDVAPRFSLDAARASLDDPRYSFDEPRASWDGHLISRSFPRMHPMVSVMEDSSPAGARQVSRSDMQILVEGNSVNCPNEGESVVPGGSMQTREYYLDSSSSRRRKSLDRSSSMRKSVVLGPEAADEVRLIPTDCFHGAKVMEGENNNDSMNNLRDSSINSQSFSRGDDCCSETFELGSGVFGGESGNSFVGSEEKKEPKKSRRWSWRIWGLSFINRRSNNKDEKYGRANGGVERSFSESWQGLGAENGDLRSRSSRNIFRSNSSVSWRNGNHNPNQIEGSGHGLGLFGSMRKSEQANGKKKRDEFVLEKNRSARYSANDVVDNGLLRFYLTPMRNSRKGGFKPNNSHSIARSVLRLY